MMTAQSVSAWINQTCGDRSVAICLALNCGPAGMKLAEAFLEPLESPEKKLRNRKLLQYPELLSPNPFRQ